MSKSKTIAYVKDALIVWSVCMYSFRSIEWLLTKRITKPYDTYNRGSKYTTYISIDVENLDNYNNGFTINQSQWEHSLIKYTKKICELFQVESFIEKKGKVNKDSSYCLYSFKVSLLTKPNEMDYLSSLTRLLELNKNSGITFPSFLFIEQ